MAIVTYRLAEFYSGLAYVDLAYDDNQLRVRSITGANNTSVPLTFTATRVTDQASWSTTIQPGETATRNLPAGLVVFEIDPTDGSLTQGVWELSCKT